MHLLDSFTNRADDIKKEIDCGLQDSVLGNWSVFSSFHGLTQRQKKQIN